MTLSYVLKHLNLVSITDKKTTKKLTTILNSILGYMKFFYCNLKNDIGKMSVSSLCLINFVLRAKFDCECHSASVCYAKSYSHTNEQQMT